MKKLAAALSGAFMSATASLGALAEEAKPLEYVDRHVVIEMDLSSSMNEVEIAAMKKGYALGFMSQEAKWDFENLRYAVSVVYFADRGHHAGTEIITSPKQAAEFVQKYLWDFTADKPAAHTLGLGSSTSNNSGLSVALELFDREQDYGFLSQTKSVVISGDDDGPDLSAQGKVLSLAQKHNATVHSAPIMAAEYSERSRAFFEGMLTTPPGIEYVSKDGYKARVQKGSTASVHTPEDMVPIVNNALRLSLY